MYFAPNALANGGIYRLVPRHTSLTGKAPVDDTGGKMHTVTGLNFDRGVRKGRRQQVLQICPIHDEPVLKGLSSLTERTG